VYSDELSRHLSEGAEENQKDKKKKLSQEAEMDVCIFKATEWILMKCDFWEIHSDIFCEFFFEPF
jgi:hypothetical protein